LRVRYQAHPADPKLLDGCAAPFFEKINLPTNGASKTTISVAAVVEIIPELGSKFENASVRPDLAA